MPTALGNAAFELPAEKPSEPIKTPLGWHILRVVKIEPPVTQSFEQAKPKLEADLIHQEAVDRIYKIANKVDDALAGGASINDVAAKFGLKTTTVPAVDVSGQDPQGKPVELPAASSEVVKLAFATSEGQTSRVTETPDGAIFALRTDKITPSEVKPLDEVRQKAIDLWQADQRRERVAKEAAELAAAVQPDNKLANVAAEKGLKAAMSAAVHPPPRARECCAAGARPQALCGKDGRNRYRFGPDRVVRRAARRGIEARERLADRDGGAVARTGRGTASRHCGGVHPSLARPLPGRDPPRGRRPAVLTGRSEHHLPGVTRHPSEPLAVYMHWPFCRSKCPYCDFNSHVRDSVDGARWTRALLADLEHQAELTPGREVGSVFFGGGTPSLMPPETVAALLDGVRSHWRRAARCRNHSRGQPEFRRSRPLPGLSPRPASTGSRSAFRRSTRRRCGFLGRLHDRDEAIAAIEHARETFPRFSFDLIYARPGPERCGLGGRARRGAGPGRRAPLALPADDRARHRLRHARAAWRTGLARGGCLGRAVRDDAGSARRGRGLPAYEISNHARPGAECRHNLAYWRYQDYVGIGPGAHGRLTRDGVKIATRQYRLPEKWLAAVEANGTGIEEAAAIDRETAIEEMLMMGLRLVEGVSRARLEASPADPRRLLFGGQARTPLIDGGFHDPRCRERLAATASRSPAAQRRSWRPPLLERAQ